jgi:hypothetical protein
MKKIILIGFLAPSEKDDGAEDRVNPNINNVDKHHPFREQRSEELLNPDEGLTAEESFLPSKDEVIIPGEKKKLKVSGHEIFQEKHELDRGRPDEKTERLGRQPGEPDDRSDVKAASKQTFGDEEKRLVETAIKNCSQQEEKGKPSQDGSVCDPERQAE